MIPLLSWTNDPFLLDKTSQKVTTLNNILEKEWNSNKSVLLTNPLENYYGYLVRRKDFVTKDEIKPEKKVRILSRMPFLPLERYPLISSQVEQKLWLLAETSRDYFYGSALSDTSIKSWKTRLERYLERQTIPLPIIRTDEELWKVLVDQAEQEKKLVIQSAKNERSTIPLELSEKLVYLLGVIDGDGHLSKHQVHIVDYSKKQIEQLQQLAKELFAVEGEIREGQSGNYYILLINGKWIVRLVNFLTGHPLGRKYEDLQEPAFLRTQPWEHLRGAYWRGLFDADASYKQAPVFTSISKILIDNLESYLISLGIKHVKRSTVNGSSIYIYSGSRRKLFEGIGSWHPEKRDQFEVLLNKNKRGEIEAFQGFAENCFTQNGYFNFELLDQQMSIVNAGIIIKQKRISANISRKELAQKLGLNFKRLLSYENNEVSPSLKVISNLCRYLNEPLMSFLESESLTIFKANNIIQLPLKPSPSLSDLMRYLHPRASSYVAILTDDLMLLTLIAKQFKLHLSELQKQRISNKALQTFLSTFGKYSKVK